MSATSAPERGTAFKPVSETPPPGWAMTMLGDVVEAVPDKIDPADQPDAPYVGLEHIESGTKRLCGLGKASDVRSAKSVFRAGDILYGKLRPYLKKIVRPDFAGVCSTDILVLRTNAKAQPAFVELVLSAPPFTAFAMASSAGINLPRTSFKKLAEFSFPLPPLAEQGRIVARLEALMARSRRARALLAEVPAHLAQARQSLLASAFRGDLTADWRSANITVESVHTTLQRVRFQASRTGRSASDAMISGVAGLSVGNVGPTPPTGWLKLPLLTVARLESGHTPSREHPEYWGGDVPWISIPDARRSHGRVIETTASSTNALGLENSAARLLPAGTVCLSRTASVGYVTVMGRPMATSQDFANWICSEALLPEFLMMAFLAEGEHLLNFGRGSTHTTIYYPELKALHIVLPSGAEQREIVRRLNAAFARLDAAATAHAAAVAELDRLNQSLLARAFSGGLVPQGTTTVLDQATPPATVQAQTYLLRFIPALLRAVGHPVSLEDLNRAVALRFLPAADLLPVVERLGGEKARAHFAASSVAYEDGAFLAAMRMLRRGNAITVATDRNGSQTLSLGAQPPPSTPAIEADSRYLAPLLGRVPAKCVTTTLRRLQSVEVAETLRATP